MTHTKLYQDDDNTLEMLNCEEILDIMNGVAITQVKLGRWCYMVKIKKNKSNT